MKYYKLFAILILTGMMSCSGEKKEKDSEESVETVLPDETNEVTVMKLNTTDFNHELCRPKIRIGRTDRQDICEERRSRDERAKARRTLYLPPCQQDSASQRCTRTRQTGTARRTDRTGLQTGRFYKSTARNHAVSQGKKRV